MSDLFDLLDAIEKPTRVQELETLIRGARQQYYNKSESSVSDEAYDAWVDELAELKGDSPEVTAIGQTPVSEWKKVQHQIPMGSLDKINTPSELTQWVLESLHNKSGLLLTTEKLDGISVSVSYRNGLFAQAATRGDGVTGEDISVNVARMQGVPARLSEPLDVTLRGEIILTKSDHAKHFPEYSNVRNAASGIAKRYDGVGAQHLTVKFYQVADGKDFQTEGEQFTWLQENGFQTPNWYVSAMLPNVKTPHDIWVEYSQSKRDSLDYEIDGLVIRVNDLSEQVSLGELNGRPKGAVAFKFAAILRETTIRDFLWQVGGTGRITPVAVFDPVQLVGAQVSQASVYNLSYIKELGLGVGARVLVSRANDVIPRVVSTVRSTGVLAPTPTACPACGGEVQLEGEYLVCCNTSSCPAQASGRLKRYVAALDIKEWGDGLLEQLVEKGLASKVSDLYRITSQQIASLDRMGLRSANKVVQTLRVKMNLELETLLGALSIPMCATSTVKLVVDAGFDTIEKIRKASISQVQSIDGIGPVKAAALCKWMSEDSGIVEELLEFGVTIQPRVKGTLTGKSVCFTGTLSRPRGELEDLVKAAGGEVKQSVGKKLTYLVMADPAATSSKAKAAAKNGTQCISEDTLLSLIS